MVEDVKAKLQADQIHAQKRADIGENTPVAMELASNKGAQIDRFTIIQSETVFDESVPSEALDGEDGDASSEYLYFSRKFHAVGLCNLDGKHIKPQKGEYTVTYQIHRSGGGSSEPLVCSKLTDPWMIATTSSRLLLQALRGLHRASLWKGPTLPTSSHWCSLSR